MTATEELRRLLDERGVEYTDRDMFGKHVFHWGTPMVNGAMFTDAGEWTELVVENASPKQAIAATLGTGTCHITDNGPWGYPYVCSECGASFDPDVNGGIFSYCPNCGRKVVDE